MSLEVETAGRLDGLRSLVDQRVEVLSGAVDAVRASGQDQTSAQRALAEELTRAQYYLHMFYNFIELNGIHRLRGVGGWSQVKST